MPPRFYERRIFPIINDLAGRVSSLRRLRAEVLAHAAGQVLEIGFGTGANLGYYSASVSHVTAIEPNSGMTDRAGRHLSSATTPVTLLAGVAEDLPFDAAAFDAVVTTLTLCSVTDPRRVLTELRRVVRPGGALLMLEHGLADDPSVARWQQRLNGVQRVVACGCNLNRPMLQLVRDAGFDVAALRTGFAPGVPRPLGWITSGCARSPA